MLCRQSYYRSFLCDGKDGAFLSFLFAEDIFSRAFDPKTDIFKGGFTALFYQLFFLSVWNFRAFFFNMPRSLKTLVITLKIISN